MSLTVNGVWKTGVWATTLWAEGLWREGEYVPPPPPLVEKTPGGGRKRRTVVRRADFSTQETYEAALRMAMLGAVSGEISTPEKPSAQRAKKTVEFKVKNDTAIPVSTKQLVDLQRVDDMEEEELIRFFMSVIEADY